MRVLDQVIVEKPLPAVTTGRSFPIGSTLVPGGANFSIFCRSAASIELLFFDLLDVHPYPYPAAVGELSSFCALSLDCLMAWDLFQNSSFFEKHMQRTYRQLRPEDTR
jgi:hypothetical protein